MDNKSKLEKWLNSDKVDESTKKELSLLTDDEIDDAFYKDLEFGTAGLRGIMGAGSNRMNVYTVRLTTQGLANEIKSYGDEFKDMGVVIAYDSRNNSHVFAKECARVLCANGIKTYLFESLRPTPELSFAVRHLKCFRGIVITASHNPKEYNGYKVYGEDGCQLSPEAADKIVEYISKTDIFEDVKIAENPSYIKLGENLDKEYIKAVTSQSMGVNIPEDFKVVYTPLHGSGNLLVRMALEKIGIKNVFVVPEQEKPDGDFPTVKSPNPENSEAFTLAIQYAKKQNADIIIGTDPDSDRIGVVVRDSKGEYFVLNGNQTGSLLCEFILRKQAEKKAIENGAVIKTIVTTDLIKEIADSYNAETIDVLTGFKFIGEKIKLFESNGEYDKFIFGLEESFGYLRGTYARDKDAVVASMLVCEMAADYKSKSMTLYDGLMSIFEKYGCFTEEVMNITLTGISGAKQIEKIMDTLRYGGISELGGCRITEIRDYKEGFNGLPKSNVLKFMLENGWVAVRPSGTEPKIKFYFSIKGKNASENREVIDNLRESIKNIIE